MEESTDDKVFSNGDRSVEECIHNGDDNVGGSGGGSFDSQSDFLPSESADRNDASSHDNNDDDDDEDEKSNNKDDLSSNLSLVDPEMVQQALQAALEDAVAMKRSDSILSTESNEPSSRSSGSLGLDEDSANQSSSFQDGSQALLLANYMEAASFEAAMLGPGTHRVVPHGKWVEGQESSSDIVRISRVSTPSLEESESSLSNLQASISTSFRRTSERYSFKSISKIPMESMPILETIVSTDGEEIVEEEHPTRTTTTAAAAEKKEVSLLEILQSCNIRVPEVPLSHDNGVSTEVHCLHAAFQDFCSTPLSIQAVQAIFDKEKYQTNSSVPLPMDVVIEKPSPGLVNLLSHNSLLLLSRPWSMSFLRILLRILTNENDAEYETSILSSCPWYDETFGVESHERSYPRAFSSVSLRNQASFSDQSIHGTGYETKKSNQLYSIVRLRGCWKLAIQKVLETLEIILNDSTHDHLKGPMTRLLGLLCIGGVSVQELRKILAMATETKASPWTQLLLIRALQTAAAGASRSFLGKADPTSFFSFTSGRGITRTINIEKSSWPFKNDFGMAVWFRAECFREPSTLLRVTNETNDGTEVSLLPISTSAESGAASASVLVITILERGKPVECVKINACIVHERVWYHVAVRHTRSRLKGMFSLSSREQLSVMLDGKPMTTETLKFPSLKDSNCKSVTLTFGANLDGQTGALYVFHNNVSDATLKALYELSSEISSSTAQSRRSVMEWDSRQGEIVRKSKVLDLNMRRDDMDDVVLSNRVVESTKHNHQFFAAVVDLEEEDETLEAGPLSKNAFNSRLYIVWDPRRIVGSTALELHSGAHATLDPQNVRPWTIDGVQNVMGSLGGIQSVLPIIRSLLSGTIESAWTSSEPTNLDDMRQRCLLCATVPDILLLFASLVRDNYQNAREMLRCGAIDLLEQSLQTNKQLGVEKRNILPAPSVVASIGVFPSLSAYFVNALLELRSTSSHYVALETKVFSRLVFNLPLWFGGPFQGSAIFSDLLPYLSMVSKQNPQKIRDCVGTKGIVKVIIEFIEVHDEESEVSESLFDRNIRELDDLRSSPSTPERWHVCEILFAMLLQVMAVGSTVDEVALIVDTLSNYLETEWEASSQEVSMRVGEAILRTGARQNRYHFSLRASLLILLLLESKPTPPDFVRNLANVCGSAQGGAAWILCSMVNSYCDRIRAIGVRCFVAYMEVTGRHADLPINLESPVGDIEKVRSSETRSLQENTINLISNVGHGLLNSNVRKGLASIGPSLRLKSQTISHLTPRVAYKLLWHLLKSHRYRIRGWTQGSLVAMVFERKNHSSLFALSSLKENCLIPDDFFQDSLTMNWTWIESTMQDINIALDPVIRCDLAVNTIIRLLRFLPYEYVDQWLSHLIRVASRNTAVMEALSNTQDWQPCVFQLASELTEKLVGSVTNENSSASKDDDQLVHGEDQQSARNDVILDRLNLALELYSMLLGNLFRHGEEKALLAIEDAASLQRVCLNGQRVFLLILTKLISNLSTFGVVSFQKMAGSPAASEHEAGSSILLKRSAKLVTDTILLNASKGLTMPSAVDCWRCLRHLNAIVVAMVTRLGFGVAELLDSENLAATGIDHATGGLFGIRLPDGEAGDVSAKQLATWYLAETQGNQLGKENDVEKRIDRRICVNIAAQALSLLDVFIFPDSLDVTHPSSQLHGLALVRNTESRIGHAQGPLLASLVRLSLLLLNQLEPCSVTLLQCSSRLRCFLHWILELVRESEALEGYSAAFNKLTAPFDRLILSIALQCQRTLKRAHSLLLQLESTTSELPFDSKDMRKKMYRRLMRVCIEMREILVTIMEQRNDVLRACLSSESFKTLQKSLESKSVHTGGIANPPKEELVQKLLRSTWVIKFEDGLLIQDSQEPDDSARDVGNDGQLALTNLVNESLEISSSFEKSLNTCFDNYLESQRKWTETGAVRDLEYEGDTVLKRLSVRHAMDLLEFSKEASAKCQAADRRWRNITQKVLDVWHDYEHWKLPRYTDALGRRIVLVRNRCFSSHEESSYDLLMGKEREREERERELRLQRKKELAELMKRNAEAFVPLTESSVVEDEEEKEPDDLDEQGGETFGAPQGPTDASKASTAEGSEVDNATEEEPLASAVVDGAAIDDVDAWAKTFIWSESESVVARFDSVMVVTLQYVVEGKLLLTTHGVYFHQTGEEINTVTKSPFVNGGAARSSTDHGRRWRLSRLKEVHGRRYMLRSQALELFFSDCEELFINFPDGQKERNRFYAKLRNSCKVPMLFSPKSLNPRTIYKKSNLTELWRKRRISNFDYVMALNRMAGRTFNDIAQYPVFPWVLADYTSEKIDLSDSRVYRDLTKPVGALNPDRLAQLLERFNELEQFGFAENERFLYGSHYSSPGVVLHFLIRQEPFTSMAIDLQSGRFDCPDRLFFDISESWKSCNTSSSDVKELIPEFFTLPEILLNTNKFPLGKTQRGLLVDDVLLPPWAKGSAHEFVRIHRMALESDYVSRNLHHWIDLIFGCKQRGPAAEAAHNVFHHLSYEGAVDLDKIIDDLDRQAAESHIQNFGQTPSQLLPKDPHPHRLSVEESWVPLINNMSSTVRLRCHTPGKQYGGKKGNCGSAIKISVLADTINVVYSELKLGTFRWYPKATKNRLKPDKLRNFSNRLISNSRAAMKRGSAAPQTMEQNSSRFSVGNWSFAMTLGGYEKEQLRRKALMPSRLVSAKDALYTDSPMLLLSCGYWDNSIKVHSTATWKLESVETGGHRGAIRCLNVSSDGSFMVSGGEDGTCRVWIVDHPDMAVALSDGYIQTALGHRTDGEQILNCCRVLWGHETPITCVDLCPDLDVVLSGSLGGKVCIHSLRRGDFIRSVRPHTKTGNGHVAVAKIALEKHGRFVVHTNDGMLHTFTINGVCLCTADAGELLHDMIITGEVLVTGGDRCHVYIRDLVTLKILSGLDLNRHGPIRSISLTPGELNPIPQHLFIGSDDGMISIVDREDVKISTGGR